jgi:hypothetical protein
MLLLQHLQEGVRMHLKSVPISVMVFVLFLVAACAPAAEPEPAPAPTPSADAPAATPDPGGPPPAADALTGSWSGDWGPSPSDRNNVTLDLKWDGSALTGTVNPGANPIPLTRAAYDAATGQIMMEADAPARGGGTVHFVIDGKVGGESMSGSWSHDAVKGDFKLTKS